MTTYNSSALESGKIDHGRACGNEIICSMTPTLTKVRSQKEGGETTNQLFSSVILRKVSTASWYLLWPRRIQASSITS